MPIIKFSVDWWNTLHQPASVFRMGGPTIHPSMLWPLLILAIGFTLLALALHLIAMRAEIMRRRVRTLTILEAERLDRLARAGARRHDGRRVMSELGPHAGFILASYAAVALVLGGLIGGDPARPPGAEAGAGGARAARRRPALRRAAS